MQLRKATMDDIPALVQLSRSSFSDAFGHLYAPEDMQAFLDTWRAPDKFAAAIADPEYGLVVAEEEGALLGYCTTHFTGSFSERPMPQPTNPSVLSQLYCAYAATGRGVGAALIEQAITEARDRGRNAMQLSVYSENFGAQRFYQRYGFTKVADIDFWVGNHRDDEFLYELAL